MSTALSDTGRSLPAGSSASSSSPVRLADVARVAGVSPATVSRVFTGAASVSPRTRDKVELAIRQLGYTRGHGRPARGPRGTVRTGSIAVVVGEEDLRMFTDPFIGRLLRAIGRAVAAAGLQQVLLIPPTTRDLRMIGRYLSGGHVDGALFVSLHSGPGLDLSGLGIPAVLCGRPLTGAEETTYVDADNTAGAQSAVRYLLRSGRRMVATIAGPPDMAAGVDRLAGYRAAMKAAGADDPALVAYGDFSQVSGEHAVRRLLDLRPGTDAVFAASDLMAAGALRALRQLGRRVPDDVALVGFDDLPLARRTQPSLTTIRQPVLDLASVLVRELLAVIATPAREPAHRVLRTELIRRQSA